MVAAVDDDDDDDGDGDGDDDHDDDEWDDAIHMIQQNMIDYDTPCS